MINELSIKVKELEVSYLHKPGVNKPRVCTIFIHGFPFNKETWKGQLQSLPEEVEGIAYDIRGFGGSAGGHTFFSIDLFSKDLFNLIDTLKLENVVLCGLSMGGYIALRAAELNLGKIAGLIVADTNASADSDAGKLKRFESIELIQTGGKAEFAEGFLKNVFTEQAINSKAKGVDSIREAILSTSNSTLCSAQLALASRTSTLDFLPQIDFPVLVVRGESDKLMTQQQAEDFLSQIPQAEFAEIPQAAHLPNLENPDTFNHHLNTFLTKHFLS